MRKRELERRLSKLERDNKILEGEFEFLYRLCLSPKPDDSELKKRVDILWADADPEDYFVVKQRSVQPSAPNDYYVTKRIAGGTYGSFGVKADAQAFADVLNEHL